VSDLSPSWWHTRLKCGEQLEVWTAKSLRPYKFWIPQFLFNLNWPVAMQPVYRFYSLWSPTRYLNHRPWTVTRISKVGSFENLPLDLSWYYVCLCAYNTWASRLKHSALELIVWIFTVVSGRLRNLVKMRQK